MSELCDVMSPGGGRVGLEFLENAPPIPGSGTGHVPADGKSPRSRPGRDPINTNTRIRERGQCVIVQEQRFFGILLGLLHQTRSQLPLLRLALVGYSDL
jgi:hypothetical protein